MKRTESYILSILTLVALVVTGCTADDETTQAEPTTKGVVFGARVSEPETRAGRTGDMDFKTLSQSGFGVFAYGFTSADFSASVAAHATLTGQVSYTGTTAVTENPTDLFFYPGNWTYTGTVVDWPEEDDAAQKISFFAYAPYTSASDLSGATEGITSIASGSGDPKVTYVVADSPDKSVDLLWGLDETDGLPWVNTTLADTPKGSGAVLFSFHHALSAIGFHVQAMIDKKNDLDDLTDVSDVMAMLAAGGNYKITVKKVTIVGPFYASGKLNLNNTAAYAPLWSEHTPDPLVNKTLTVANSLVNAAFRHPDDVATTTEKATSVMDNGELSGVTQAAEQLLIAQTTGGVEQCFYVIPNSTEQDYTVTLDWCISGKDTDGSTVVFEDRTSTVTLENWTWAAGTKYYLNFVMGLKTFKLSVNAIDWTAETKTVNVTTENGTSASESLARKRR